MKAMILAAGLGKRMQPLTANLPKPLLKVADKSLIEHQIDKLVAAGISEIVINHYYLGAMIEAQLGDGSRYGAKLVYSPESQRLETAGGIINCLPALADDCFVVVNADIWTDYDFSKLAAIDGVNTLAHLVLVANAEHNPYGDFHLDSQGRAHEQSQRQGAALTFSGISLLHRNLFQGYAVAPLALAPILRRAMKTGKVSAENYTGVWVDIGTPQRLEAVNASFAQGNGDSSN
ncbi:MAG: hypothetical protein COC19_03295 [SAR86 cluster bacterium]|uniref:Nucleotidyl transferase domain-containing protein n=1 Tax=SAR86 cluster bacterium TaxID=2030880 RepID=A0A2A4MQ23_9GAMM|nr:MAG: hypothetical protein COC19_03295 [SAR86 cluster bacterium]